MVEPQIVVLVVAGSSPVGHPPLQIQIIKFQLSTVEICNSVQLPRDKDERSH